MILDCIEKSLRGLQLTPSEAAEAMDAVVTGLASETQTLALFTAMSMNDTSAEALAAMTQVLRRHLIDNPSIPEADAIVFKICGEMAPEKSGSDFMPQLAAAFVMAGAGLRVLYAAPREDSAGSDFAQLMNLLGIRPRDFFRKDESANKKDASASNANFSFLTAIPLNDPSGRIEYARGHLPIPTALDLILPFACASSSATVVCDIGSFAEPKIVAQALVLLGVGNASILGVKDAGGDSANCEMHLVQVANGMLKYAVVDEGTFGIEPPASSRTAADPAEIADRIRSALDGANGPDRDAVLVRAAAGLVCCGKTRDFLEGVRLASETIDMGRAKGAMNRLCTSSRPDR